MRVYDIKKSKGGTTMKLVVLFSLILSILHSILFYGQKWGISVFLFTITGIFLLIQILQKNGIIKNKKALLLCVPIIILSSTYFIFNNSFFNFFNMIVIFILLAIMLIIVATGELKIHQLIQNLFILYLGPVEEMGESTREITNCFSKKQEREKEKNKLYKKIGKGILCSLPLLILVLILLITADEMFASIFKNIFSNIFKIINIKSIYSILFRIFIIIALTLYFIGMMIKIKNKKLDNEETAKQRKIKIDVITLNTLVTMLNVIYFIFSITQGIYLVKQISNTTMIDYAHYARTGFFQLMAVSIINFVVIFLCKNNNKEVSSIVKKYIKVMNILLAVFTIVILISSVIRMNLYEREYGYTFLRLMVYFIQITELILMVPTMIYIVKEKFNIAKWYMVITICMYIAINFINIDFIIAKGNIDRYFNAPEDQKNKIDFSYLQEKTSTDALIEITRLLETEDKNLKVRVNNYLLTQYADLKEKHSWQEFNLSKERAKKELEKLNLSYMGPSSYEKTNRNYNSRR